MLMIVIESKASKAIIMRRMLGWPITSMMKLINMVYSNDADDDA